MVQGSVLDDHISCMTSFGTSAAFFDFLTKALQKDYEQRPRCLMLLQHEFLTLMDENKAKAALFEALKIARPSLLRKQEPEWNFAAEQV